MNSTRPQQTIFQRQSISGFGYWSGHLINVEFRPADEDTGIVFVRSDLGRDARVAAILANRVDSARRTTLEFDGVRIDMVEHLLAALAGMQIHNCEVWVDAAEMPASDGSCREATKALNAAGIVEQKAARRAITLSRPCRVGDQRSWIEAHPSALPGLTVRYDLDYGIDSAIGKQHYQIALTPDAFADEIAPARTFVLQQEALQFQQQGFGKNLTFEDILVFGPSGPIDNDLRFPEECARHKILDLVGDVSLVGCDIHANILAHRSGHQLNAALVECILREIASKRVQVPA